MKHHLLFSTAGQRVAFLALIPYACGGANGLFEVPEPTGKAVPLAIDACAAPGGGVVYLPPWQYVSGPLWSKDNVELRLEAGATIHDFTINGAQGTARGTSLMLGQAERRLENITVANLRVRMLAENRPDKRATDALVFQTIDRLTLRNVDLWIAWVARKE